MLEEPAEVVEIVGNFARVRAYPKLACGSCSARSGCGTSLLSSLFPERGRTFMAQNTIGATIGDRVVVGVDESSMQRASLLMYLVPLLGFFGGALVGVDYSEGASVLGAVSGLFLGLYAVRKWTSPCFRKQNLHMRILRIEPSAGAFLTIARNREQV